MVRLEIQNTKSKSANDRNLHSSMVRLEIRRYNSSIYRYRDIYIPVWLDQKSIKKVYITIENTNLHSSMVRLEIRLRQRLARQLTYLHSSMVRLEMSSLYCKKSLFILFTFQYGQIRNSSRNNITNTRNEIYIPVWLDQKSFLSLNYVVNSAIYIPVWLDQK